MSEVIRLLKKFGGISLLEQYIRTGVFPTAVAELILLGKRRTALEILRLTIQHKIRQKLERKYKKYLDEFDKKFDNSLRHVSSNKVWICWLQGIENAPLLVKSCFESVKKNLINKEIIIVTRENYKDFVEIPDYIIEKWEKGIITNTHFTDLLRLELLIKHGGVWIDSTVLCSCPEDEIPNYFFDSELFFYQSLKPGRDGKSIYISSWYINAKTNNKILMATRMLCYIYWEKNNRMIDYFLLHHFFSIVLDRYNEEWSKIMPRDNSAPHLLLLRLFDSYDEIMWNSIKAQTPFHKLSYKFTQDETNKTDTYYKKIIEKY